MSKPELERLIADVKADKDLQDKIKSIHPSNERVVEWANAHGYDITLDEFDAHIRKQKGELTHEELNRVVGGRGLSYDWTVTNQQGESHTYDPLQLAVIGHDMFIAHPVAAQIDQGWAGYKDTWNADKEMVQDSSPSDLIGAAQEHGASISESGSLTNVTFSEGVQIDRQVQYDSGQERSETLVSLPDGVSVGHQSLVEPGDVRLNEGTQIKLSGGGSYAGTLGGWHAFYSAEGELETDGPSDFEFSKAGVDTTFHVSKTPAGANVTVTNDQGSSDHQVSLPTAEQDWAAHPEAPAVWNDPSTQIDMKGNTGWMLEHTDASGPETTFTSASGQEFFLPHLPTSDWTITNSQGDYHTFTRPQIYGEEVKLAYNGEADWLAAHPEIEPAVADVRAVKEGVAQKAVAQIEDTWIATETTAVEDWNADKAAAVADAQNQDVQNWIRDFDTLKEDGGGTLPNGATLEPYYNDWVITGTSGKQVSFSGGDVFVVGIEPGYDGGGYFDYYSADPQTGREQPLWEFRTKSGYTFGSNVPISSDTWGNVFSTPNFAVYHELVNPQESWDITWDFDYYDENMPEDYEVGKEVAWGPGGVTTSGSDLDGVTVQVADGSIEMEGSKATFTPGSGVVLQPGVERPGNYSIEPVSGRSDAWLISAPYGEQWTIEKGDNPITPQSVERDRFEQAHPSATTIGSDVTVQHNWYVTDSSGELVRQYSSNQLREDGQYWEAAHPEGAQGIETWTTDTKAYEAAKQMWARDGVDPQGLPEGTVSGSKGEVSYTFAPGVPGESGYDLVIEGPDTYFHTETMEYLGTPSRWVGYDSDKTGEENVVDVVYSNGQVENLFVNDFGYVRAEGSNYGQVVGPRGDWRFSRVAGPDNRPLDTQVVLPDGEDVTLTTNTMIQGPHGRSVERNEVPGADPEMMVALRDGTDISWQKSDQTHREDGVPFWQANMEYFAVGGVGGQEFEWSPDQGLSYHNGHTVEYLTPGGDFGTSGPPSYGTLLDGETYSLMGNSWSFQTPHATVDLYAEYGYYGSRDSTVFETDEVVVEFNNGITLLHQPHYTEAYTEDQPGEMLWVAGKLDQVGEKELRPVQVSFETPSGGTETIAPREQVGGGADPSNNVLFTYKGPDGNVFSFDSRTKVYEDGVWTQEGNPTFSLDGAQIVRGQDETIMGPDGRISVDWGVSSQDLPDGSSRSGSSSGLVVVGVHRDVQVVQTEQDGHNAWGIDNTRVLSPYTYASKVQSGEATVPAAVSTNEVVFSQVAVFSNEAEAVDTTTTVQVEVEVETLVVAFGVLFLT